MFLKVPEGFQQKKFSSCADTLLLPISKPLHLHKMHAPGGQSKDIPCVFWETQRMYFLQDEATSAETFWRIIKQAILTNMGNTKQSKINSDFLASLTLTRVVTSNLFVAAKH